MSRLNEKKNAHNTITYYFVESVNDNRSTACWMASLLKNNILVSEYITLKDLANRNDEGNTNKQLTAKATYDEIVKELDQREIDIISITGKFDGKPIVVGVDLRDCHVFVTTRNKESADLRMIEKQLDLV